MPSLRTQALTLLPSPASQRAATPPGLPLPGRHSGEKWGFTPSIGERGQELRGEGQM